MAKKGAGALQLEVDNEEDWTKLVEKEGLILVDVFSEWCGPCTGMVGNLRKVKLEIGGDVLTLATAKCDNIPCLSRFVDKSRPTWMFIANQRMIRLMFGADAPQLIRTLIEEISLQRKAMESGSSREGINFDELTDEEQKIVDEEIKIKEEAERIEMQAKENAIIARRKEVANNLLDHLADFNFVMLWPHVAMDGISQMNTAVKETPMSSFGKQTKTALKDEDLYEMLYYSSRKFTDLEIGELKKTDVPGFLFQRTRDDVDPIQTFLGLFYGEMGAPPGDEESLAMKLSKIIKIPKEKNPDEEPDEELVDEEFRIPGLYVPENENCKVLAMRILFPNVTAKFDLPEVEPTPPHLMIAFDAFKKNDVLQCASECPEGTMRLGFFTSIDPEEAKLLAKTGEQYDLLPHKPYDAKLIVQVSKENSEPLLSYSTFGPMYISPNTVVGEKECAAIFPEGYDKPDSEPEPKHVKKKSKKRSRGSKGSKSSLEAEETGEIVSEENASEEGLEEVAEEDDDEVDDDDMGDEPLADCEPPTDPELEPEPDDESEADKATETECL